MQSVNKRLKELLRNFERWRDHEMRGSRAWDAYDQCASRLYCLFEQELSEAGLARACYNEPTPATKDNSHDNPQAVYETVKEASSSSSEAQAQGALRRSQRIGLQVRNGKHGNGDPVPFASDRTPQWTPKEK